MHIILKKTIFLVIVLSLFCFPLSFSQETNDITGFVLDVETNEPISYISVFVANSTRGTITNDKGFFDLGKLQNGSYELVFQHLGYEKYIRRINVYEDKSVNLIIKLIQKSVGIDEIIKKADTINWNENFNKFRDVFLGVKSNINGCKILNPKDIFFYYNEEKKLLSAFASKPIMIENKFLGYKIHYFLDNFKYYVDDIYYNYSGSIFYEELKPESLFKAISWNRRRKRFYYGSLLHFIRSLHDMTYLDEGFSVKNYEGIHFINIPQKKQTNLFEADARFKQMQDALNSKKELEKIMDLPTNRELFYNSFVVEQQNSEQKKLIFSGTLSVKYNNYISYISLDNDFVMFEKSGYIDKPVKLVTQGDFALLRNLTYMLPDDYYPNVIRAKKK
ncbi:carboxypeptidase-like regulatory domain-containing protein [Bacteroidota bacterium]